MVQGFILIVLGLQLIEATLAIAKNRTIDDQLGDSDSGIIPTYLPREKGVWKTYSCSTCFGGSYIAATASPSAPASITLEFEGTAIWVYFILASNLTKASFLMDAKASSAYLHKAVTNVTDPTFNTLVFQETSLTIGWHKLQITVSETDKPLFAAFDFARYQYEDGVVQASYTTDSPRASGAPSQLALVPASTPSAEDTNPSQLLTETALGEAAEPGSSVANGALSALNIIAAAVGGVALVMLLAVVLVFLLCFRRRQRQLHKCPSVDSQQVAFNDRTSFDYKGTDQRYTTTVQHPFTHLLPAGPLSTTSQRSTGDVKRREIFISTSPPTTPGSFLESQDQPRTLEFQRTWGFLSSSLQNGIVCEKAAIQPQTNGQEHLQDVAEITSQIFQLQERMESLHRQRQSSMAPRLAAEPPGYCMERSSFYLNWNVGQPETRFVA